ncbi:MAG TPA: GNAT family N-acetyltransferase [Candidatus Koribacter sp.]|jgi:GNAT superfamily N-acetyltransferase
MFDWTTGDLSEGMSCYRRGQFFEAHEHWEAVWLRMEEPEKTFLQALIQVAGAFHHFHRDNRNGARSMMRKALQKLEKYPAEFGGIEVETLRGNLRGWLVAFDTELVEVPAVPQIQLVPSEIQIRRFQSGDAEAFRALNEAWISKLFVLEEPDRKALADPQGSIIDGGGSIMMAFVGTEAVGTCALLAEGDRVFELAKMAVSDAWQGHGIGRKILEATIEESRRIGARAVRLETNSSLANAIHLYEAVGFRHIRPEHPSPYARADVFMEMKF